MGGVFQHSDTFLPVEMKHKLWGSNGAEVCPQLSISACKGISLEDGEWYAYRRNYFELNCRVALLSKSGPGISSLFIDKKHQVTEFFLAVSATYANGDDTSLVQFTSLRLKGPWYTPTPISLPLTAGEVSLNFKRLQFKTATPNNSSRVKQKKPCRLRVRLFAVSTNGHSTCIAEAFSFPLFVRGRSPCHYNRKKPTSPSSITSPCTSVEDSVQKSHSEDPLEVFCS